MTMYFCVRLHSFHVTGCGQTHWIYITDLILITNARGKRSHSMGQGAGAGGQRYLPKVTGLQVAVPGLELGPSEPVVVSFMHQFGEAMVADYLVKHEPRCCCKGIL